MLVELMGPAGAGKSTVFDGLLRRCDRCAPMPVLRRRPYSGILAWNLVGVLAMLLRRRALLRRWTGRQLVAMAYLQGLPRALRRPEWRGGRTVVFDQGPLFLLTRPSLRDERIAEWWQRTFDDWRGLLDAVVWLEAPDPVLVDRINARAKDHRIKGSAGDGALRFLAESRAGYEEALDRLGTGAPRPRILRFDTSRRSADEVVDEILHALPGGAGG